MKTIPEVAKAIYAGVVSALGSLTVVLVGHTSLSQVTAGQWVTTALAALVSAGGVFGISNRTAP